MMDVTRLAPSPTGALHLGNARTFLANWLVARQQRWKIVLRIEDLDGPRIKRGADTQAIDDLRWLGIDWDEGPVYQSNRTNLYQDAVATLVTRGLAYPCICTRKEASLAASAPHAEDGASVYPGTCRGRFASIEQARQANDGKMPAIRFAVPDEPLEFSDGFRGPVRFENLARQLGDFVIAKADMTPAYQLSVVVDDAGMGVTQIIRGDDLIDSTPRQILLYRALSLKSRIPRYAHLPLVVGPDGRRLAKRHGDTRLSFYRDAGVPAERVLALLARWYGIDAGDSATIDQMLQDFDLARIPRDPIIMSPADDAWLRGK